MFVCRSNYTEKKLLDFTRELIQTGKLKNVGIIINGIRSDASYGYGYNYGYAYGYKQSEDS
jgi:hypothetical protein